MKLFFSFAQFPCRKAAALIAFLSLVAFAQAPSRPAATKPAAAKPGAAKPAATKPKPAAAPAGQAPATTAAPAQPATPAKVQERSLTRMIAGKPERDEFEAERRVALLVAPSYRGSGLAHLRFTVADIRALKVELERQGYTVIEIGPAEATSDSVRQSLQNAKQLFEGSKQGTFLFAFSGHGFQSADKDGKPGKNYLVTTGANESNLEQEALSLDEVQTLMQASGARRRVILADACRNVPDAKSTDPKRVMSDFQTAEGTVVLLSTSPGGVSYEDEDLQHGLFTYHLLDALRGKAAKDGYITAYDLKTYLERTVPAAAIQKQKIQKPFYRGEHSGDFLLATAAPAPPETVTKPNAEGPLVDAETPVLFEVRAEGGAPRKVYANVDQNKLVLVDAQTYAPIAILHERVTEEKKDDKKDNKDKAAAAAPPTPPGEKPRVFVGNSAGDNRVYHVAAFFKGNDINTIEGRVGAPCPGNRACITASQIPLLPGEKRSGNKIEMAKGMAQMGANVVGMFSPFGKAQQIANKAQTALSAAELLDSSLREPLKFDWRAYQLAMTLKRF